ncbi:hypothetical protein [Streptomyces sp. NPDC059708]|uniref:hypothetical protein n=1 Tax=Streptomyces sp. NPDC059708 TaxID=3346916 RepID=UPI00369F4A16
MSFEEEWSAARAAATLRLDHTPASTRATGAAGADLALDQDHIGAVGSEAYRLHARLQTDGRHAATASAEAAGALAREGFACGSALARANGRWETQVKTLVAACAQISNGLDYSLSSHAKEEQRLYAEFTSSKIDEYLR